ncbi:DUF5615 family PIN-like protein [Scytonema sp. UIC 10036]|uniref:DUF5615 family PIN-like protein n=1 Tax=Scytonema sp. UIC 10036 TaxID=2304196 RepID=UPI00325ACDBA
MNIKLDENLGNLRVVTRLRLAGHDVTTVREQGLTSAPDEELIDVCRDEGGYWLPATEDLEIA